MPTLLLFSLALAAAPANPCATLDLPSALSLASRRSDEVAIARAQAQVAASDQALARALQWIPQGSITVVTGPVPAAHGTVVQAEGNTTNRSLRNLSVFGRVDVNLVQPLFTWGRLTAARKAADEGYRARTLLVKKKIADVQLRVIRLFWAQAVAKRLLDIAADVDKALAKVRSKIDEDLQKQKGDITLEDKFRVGLFAGELASREADARQALQLARIGLAATLSLDPRQVQFETPPLEATATKPPPLKTLLAEAESQRPDLQALDAAIAARGAEVQADGAAMLPAVFAAGEFSYAYAPNRDLQLNPWVHDPFNELSLGIIVGLRQNLAFPLLIAKKKKAEAQLRQMRVQRDGLVRLIDTQVEGALVELQTARDKLAAAQGALGSGKSWFRSAAENFGLGIDDAKTLLEAYKGYIQAQVNLASAGYVMLVAQAKLAELTGQALSHGEGKCISP